MDTENIYAPLTEEEYNYLKTELAGIVHYLPENLMNPFWAFCNRIRNQRVNQPCSCKSSARLWGSCVEDLREFVKNIDGNQHGEQ
jgi:hypothetical protein